MSTKPRTYPTWQITGSAFEALKCLQRLFDGHLEGAPAPGYELYDLEQTYADFPARYEFSCRGQHVCSVYIKTEYVGYHVDGAPQCGRTFYHPYIVTYLKKDGRWQTVGLTVNEVYPDVPGEGPNRDMKNVPLADETTRFHIPTPHEPVPCL
ncbi:MAG: hypothetical protein Q7S64_01465 [bacterium]|nr:hypothetical protein [bacterium]